MRGAQFAELAAFAAIAEHRSFAKAAMHIGVSRSMLSQTLRTLEERLSVRLLNRTTRSVSVTDAGARLLARIRPSLFELNAAVSRDCESSARPDGIVADCRAAAGRNPADESPFSSRASCVNIQASIWTLPSSRCRQTLLPEGFDAAIRIGEQIERDMIAMRVIGEVRFLVVASPDYLARHPRPKTPGDLRHHDCIRNRLPKSGQSLDGTLKGMVELSTWQVEGRLIVNDIELSIRAVRDGLGLAYLLYDYVAADLKAGKLVPVLEDWSPRLSGFFLYYSSHRQMSGPLQAFIALLKAEAARRGVSRQRRQTWASIHLTASWESHGDK